MRKIRIKVKHLTYILAGILITVFILLPNALFIYAQTMERGNVEASKVYYKRYIDLFPWGGKRAEALYNLAQKIIPEDSRSGRYKVYSAGFSGGGQHITSQMIENGAAYYLKVIEEYEDSEFYTKSYYNLVDLYTMSGMFSEAEKLIDEGFKSNREDIRLAAYKYNMLNHMIGGEYEEARKIGMKYINENKADPDIYMLMGDIDYYDRKLQDAVKYYEKARDMNKWERGKRPGEFMMPYYKNLWVDGRIDLVKKLMEEEGDSSIYGKVIINGKPAPFIFIYMADQQSGMSGSIGDEDRKISAITDFEGNFIMPNLPEGDYIMGAGIPTIYLDRTRFQTPSEGYFHLNKGEKKEFNFNFVPPMKLVKPKGTVAPVDNRVEIEWERVEGAAYYLIRLIAFEKHNANVGSYSSFSPTDRIFDTKYTLDIDEVNMGEYGFMMSDEGELNPHAYLGIFYPGCTVPLYVEAFDAGGGLIKSTVPMKIDFKDMAVISLPGENLTESDRLVLERKPEEAVLSYEKDLEKNPEDIHAMRVLSRIYSLGTRRKHIADGEFNIEGSDRDRALELTRRLSQITGDTSYLKLMLRRRFPDYPEEADWILKEYDKLPEEDLEAEDFAVMGRMNMHLKDYNEADRYFEKVYDAYKNTNYYDLAPVIMRLYLKDYDGALRFFDILDLRYYNVDRYEFQGDIKSLEGIKKDSLEYEKFEEALEIIMSFRGNKEYKEQYSGIYNTIGDKVLSRLLKNIGNYYHVFDRIQD